MTNSQSISTDQSILAAAEKLFLDKGYAKTSTTEIARVAGCNQALVHYYFRSKENLFKQIFENKIKMFVLSLLQVNEDDIPFEEKLKQHINSHFEMLRANRKLPVLLFNEVSTNADLAQKLYEKISYLPLTVIEHLQKDLDVEFESGRICKTDARTLLLTVFSLNVMPFLATPILNLFLHNSEKLLETMLDHRKEENIKFILKSLKP